MIRQMAGETRLYLEDWFEADVDDDPSLIYVCYYYFGGQRVALRTASGVTYLHADHLGSTAETTGQETSEQLYYPYGSQRTEDEVATPRRFTGQSWEEAIGLYDYKARYYDPALGRFIQPDTIVPEPGNPQALNRYSYALNNPVRYTDPTGHGPASDSGGGPSTFPWWLYVFPPSIRNVQDGGRYCVGKLLHGDKLVSLYLPQEVYHFSDGTVGTSRHDPSKTVLVSADTYVADDWYGNDPGACYGPHQEADDRVAWYSIDARGRTELLSFEEGLIGAYQCYSSLPEDLPPGLNATRAEIYGNAIPMGAAGLAGYLGAGRVNTFVLQTNNAGQYRLIVATIQIMQRQQGLEVSYVTSGGFHPRGAHGPNEPEKAY